MKKGEKVFAIGAVIGVISGYVAGILTAPKSGKETRKDIKQGASKIRVESEKQLKKLHSDLQGLIKEAEVYRRKASVKARVELDKAIKEAAIAKDKAREILSALHDGDVDDPNLQAAVKEVKRAKKNLETYLKKR